MMIVAQRGWQAASGLLTVVLVARFLTPIQQGWYYSFLSLAAIYTLFDLGLSIVIIQLTAHFFVSTKWLSKGHTSGESSHQFHALLSLSARIYLALAIAFLVLLFPAGCVFFLHHGSADALPLNTWLPAWSVLCAATATGILALPFLAVIEGSGRVREAYQVRLAQGVIGALGAWVAIACGKGLWAPALPAIAAPMIAAIWLLLQRPGLLSVARRASPGAHMSWRTEIWPLQWRIGLSWLSGYLLTQIYTPLLFHTQGAVVAGQMGLSLTIANMLGLLAQSWMARRIPAMAQAASRRDWPRLDTLFKHDFRISTLAFIAGALVLCGMRFLLDRTAYATRVLPFWPFAGLLGVALLNNVIGMLAAQLRSFRREPLVWVAVAGACLTVPISAWAAQRYSAEGVVVALLLVQTVFILPVSTFVWRRCNHLWRLPS